MWFKTGGGGVVQREKSTKGQREKRIEEAKREENSAGI